MVEDEVEGPAAAGIRAQVRVGDAADARERLADRAQAAQVGGGVEGDLVAEEDPLAGGQPVGLGQRAVVGGDQVARDAAQVVAEAVEGVERRRGALGGRGRRGRQLGTRRRRGRGRGRRLGIQLRLKRALALLQPGQHGLDVFGHRPIRRFAVV